MPLFFFDVLNDRLEDDEGIEFPNAAIARREAIKAAGHILSDSEGDIHDGKPWIMHVRDTNGVTICNLHFTTSDR